MSVRYPSLMDHRVDDERATRVIDSILGLAERISGQFADAANEYQLTAMQATALIRLEAPVAMHQLATALACDRSNITSLVDRLEERGLVRREAGTKDRRVKTLVLTAEGARLHAELRHRLYDPGLASRVLTNQEISELETLLAKINGGQAKTTAKGLANEPSEPDESPSTLGD